MGKFGDLLVNMISLFNYDLVIVFDFHMKIYVESHMLNLLANEGALSFI
jgi:hypothetical protein